VTSERRKLGLGFEVAMLNVSRLIKGSIAALAVVAGGATAMTVERAPYVATAPEFPNNARQPTVNRFRLEFAAPSENIGDKARGRAPNQSFTLAAGVKGDRLPMTRTRAARQRKRRLIDGDYPFAAIGWQRSLAEAAPSLSKLDAGDQGAFSRGCAACQTAADGGGSVSKAGKLRPHQTIAAARPAARG
jgi:hypothetical protein